MTKRLDRLHHEHTPILFAALIDGHKRGKQVIVSVQKYFSDIKELSER